MSQQYSLRWNNHQPNFISMFTNLLNTQTLVDVTLAADGKHLQAHKVVLSACSSYFQALFVDNPSQHPIVILKDVSFADLRTMVDFMYYGEVNVTEEQLPQVLDTAKHLKIKGLTEMPDSTSLTRSQGGDLQSSIESESQRLSASPPASPTHKRRKRRKSSTGSTSLNMVGDERVDAGNQTGDMPRSDTITLSSVVRRREMHNDSMNAHQAADPHNMSVEQLGMDANTGSLSQGGQWSMIEHTYPRYPNACLGTGLTADPTMYGMIGSHVDPGDINEYRQSLDVTGPSPGPSCLPEQVQQDPQHQAPPKRRRTTNPQSDEKFQRALEAVRFGGIGFCKAAKMFGVNNRTLWLEYKKKGYPNNRPSIRNRIKREHTTPPPEHKEDMHQPEQQMALICPPHPVPVGFIDSRPVDFPLQVAEGTSEAYSDQARLRRAKLFRRQSRLPEERELRKQASEPAPSSSTPTLQKHESYPQYGKIKRAKPHEQEVGSLLIRAVTVVDRPGATGAVDAGAAAGAGGEATQRASHTPAVRSGPPLSCNFCWNTVDECGRILRRKTQYHCPECRTNLCIVPCFHEYHDGTARDCPAAGAVKAEPITCKPSILDH